MEPSDGTKRWNQAMEPSDGTKRWLASSAKVKI